MDEYGRAERDAPYFPQSTPRWGGVGGNGERGGKEVGVGWCRREGMAVREVGWTPGS